MNAAYKPYRPRGASPRLQDVLDRMTGKDTQPVVSHTSVTYSVSDTLRAKAVLDRLLALPGRNELVSIEKVTKEVDELDE